MEYVYEKMRNRVVKCIRSSKCSFLSNLSRSANDPQKFWKIVNSLISFSSYVPTLAYNNLLVSEDTDKAEELNTFFCECFNKSDPPHQYSSYQYLSNSILGHL